MKVIQLKGLDTDLYPLIGPLVMNPKVLKANNNYPFKTTANHQWYIAVNDQEEVMGFLPVENKKSTSVINNYYLKEDPAILASRKGDINIIKFVKNKFKSLLYQFVNIFGIGSLFLHFLSWLVYIILI